MKQLALTLAATLALAAPAFACSNDAPTHDETAAAPGAHACCAKAEAAAATCPHAARAAAATAAEAKPDCCAQAEKTAGDCHGAVKPTQTAEAGAKHDCTAGMGLTTAAKATAPAAAAQNSPAAPTLAAEAPAERRVSLTGRVLCERCNLGRSDSCHSVFQADGQEALIDVSTESDIMGLRKASEHGQKTLKLEGVMQDGANGPELRVLSWAAPSV